MPYMFGTPCMLPLFLSIHLVSACIVVDIAKADCSQYSLYASPHTVHPIFPIHRIRLNMRLTGRSCGNDRSHLGAPQLYIGSLASFGKGSLSSAQ